jgi:alanine dehydrogenase
MEVLRSIEVEFGARVVTVYSSRDAFEHHVLSADLVIGAVLVPGAAAPKLVSREMVKDMKQGAVVVDIAIDQGGCFETSRPTTHADPTYIVDDVVHYCVTNMPGAVPRTSTYALNNATLPFVLALANKGWKRALADDAHLRDGLNIAHGSVTHPEVARALNLPYVAAEEAIRG